jgi:ATP-binding cassette, subfamily C, bacterial CydCD
VKPLDPRLLRHARRAVAAIAVLAALGLASAALVIAQAWLLAAMIANVFIDKATLAACAVPLAVLAAVTAGRAAVAWAAQAAAHRACAEAKTELRTALLARVLALGPGWRRASGDCANGGRRRDAAALTELATTGLDGLDGYFTSYLPALIGAVAVPVAVLITITVADPVSGITVLCTLPLVPLFGALIGRATGRRATQRWRALATLAHHFHDVVTGLPTLRVFGRAQAQRGQIARVTDEYRRATMATLRLAFLSSLALELIATMSVALVATEIGLRLAYGHLDLRTGLLVLICAPEAYLPLRALGTQFHATADGLAAAEEVFAILETEPETETEIPVPVPGSAGLFSPAASYAPAADRSIHVDAVSVRHEGRAAPAPDRTTFTIEPGRLTVLVGPSGCGKTTLLSCLLGFTTPTSGSIRSKSFIRNGPVVPAAGQPDAFDARNTAVPLSPADPQPSAAPHGPNVFGWLPQHPTLFTGTVAENIRLGWPAAPDEAVAAAVRDAALDDVPLDRVLGDRGAGLSAGQRRRVALARALLPGRPVLLLDEPTAGLDAERESVVIETLRRYAGAGHAVLAVSHRPAVIAAADTLVDLTLSAEPLSAEPLSATPPTGTRLSSTPSTAADLSPVLSAGADLSPAPSTPIGDVIGVYDRSQIGPHRG